MIETFLKQRIRRRHAEQRRFFREIFDWTILLYLVVPVGLFIIYETVQILNGQADWVQTVPVAWIFTWMDSVWIPARLLRLVRTGGSSLLQTGFWSDRPNEAVFCSVPLLADFSIDCRLTSTLFSIT